MSTDISVAQGREFLSIPGPTNIPDRVLSAMHRPAVDLYAGAILDTTDVVHKELARVMKTEGPCHIYIANGHGAWEAALANVLSRGDKILVLASGRFAIVWGTMAKSMHIDVEVLERSERRAVDPQAVEDRLRQDTKGEIKAVLVVQVDTASGVKNDLPAIRKAVDAANHPALIMADCVASLACMDYRMDEWGMDVTVGGSQKGLMTPPGLGFTAASEKAMYAHKSADLRTKYWCWTERGGEEHYMKYCGTAPEHLLWGLAEAFKMLAEEGMENVFRRHEILAAATHAALENWCAAGAMSINAEVAAERAPSVTAIRMAEGKSPYRLSTYCREKLGLVLGSGIGPLEGKGWRIGHMGYANAPMTMGTLGGIDAALKALGIPHEKGALEAASQVFADAVPAKGALKVDQAAE